MFLYLEGLKSILKQIHCELLTNRMMNERLWNKMNSLSSEFAIKKLMVPGLSFSNDSKDKKILDQFPFSTEKSVLDCEKVLQADDDIKEKIVCIV